MAIRKLLDVVRGVGKQRLRREQHDGDPRKLTGQHRKWRDLSSAAGIVRQARLTSKDSDVPATLGGYETWPWESQRVHWKI
jgi:hypothetical protein